MFELVLIILLLVVGGLYVVGGIAARAGRRPRNPLVGYRTAPMRASDRAWRAGHRAAWAPILLTGLVPLGAGIAALIGPSDARLIWFAIAGLGIAVGTLVGRPIADRAVRGMPA